MGKVYGMWIKYKTIKNMMWNPGWCGSVDWVLACEPKGPRFDSQSGLHSWVTDQVPEVGKRGMFSFKLLQRKGVLICGGWFEFPHSLSQLWLRLWLECDFPAAHLASSHPLTWADYMVQFFLYCPWFFPSFQPEEHVWFAGLIPRLWKMTEDWTGMRSVIHFREWIGFTSATQRLFSQKRGHSSYPLIKGKVRKWDSTISENYSYSEEVSSWGKTNKQTKKPTKNTNRVPSE